MFDAQSSYVREALQGAPYSERDRVKRLLAIERYARTSVRGWIHGMMIEQLWREENGAFRAIVSELNPALLNEKARAEEEKRARRWTYAHLEDEEKKRDAWVKAGGRT